MTISTRTRFEIFKRDNFTCKYCGRKSPEVVLEVDHILAVSKGGPDDRMNLTTSCWDCNRGKSDVSLTSTMTGEDPHDAAILLLEKQRQLAEYNAILAVDYERRLAEFEKLKDYWETSIGANNKRYGSGIIGLQGRDRSWLLNTLKIVPFTTVKEAMDTALFSKKTHGLAYVNGIIKRWKEENSQGE